MGWVKIDDGFTMHPKVIGLSFEAKWAYLEALCYAAKYETDGVVPAAVAANGSVRAELVAAGLWENGPASVSVHDYLLYNPSRSELEQKRNRSRNIRASREGVVDLGLGLEEARSAFEAFWTAYPRKVGKPKARLAFEAALRSGVDPSAVVLGAELYRTDPNRTDEFTAHPTTWLNREGWADDPIPQRSNGKTPAKPVAYHQPFCAECRESHPPGNHIPTMDGSR